MLILRRKAGESLMIGDDIKVVVLSSDDNGVRLAVDAPRSVPVLRTELWNAMDVNIDASHEQSEPEELLAMLEHMQESL